MPTSTLRYYSSGAVGAPQLSGSVGSLLTVLDAVLIGTAGIAYGSTPSAGWTKPIANAGNIGCYVQGTGSAGFGIVVNDNGPNVTSTFKEAWVTGWESIAGIGAPVGTGNGQFPLPSQLLTTGHAVIRKSVSASATAVPWQIFADSRSVYLFTLTGDTAGYYQSFVFGDIFSIKNTTDTARCILIGNPTENSSQGAFGGQCLCNTFLAAHFMARSFGGNGASITIGKHGDLSRSSNAQTTLDGTGQTPNGPDGSFYLSPVWVTENSASITRGRLRGVFHVGHPSSSFADGQVITGTGDYSGKTFTIVRDLTYAGSGLFPFVAIETSATVETN